ncbi:RidA family protein [Anthocerotibacter panamensis]|uniref:RidA family protein n=1 Tax=Anthocerotibacter panamensis TaxID=2857077 RepID=UPI001C4030E1|nr:RidA family protein [Anthocerotibacter panamensis]
MIQRVQGQGNQGPYSQGVIVDGWVYTSGQIPVVPETGAILSGPIEEQARQVFSNLKSVLSQCGCNLSQVVKVTVFLTDMGDFAAFNTVYSEFFTQDRPARSCVQVAALPRGVSVEIEAVGYLS